ncbi:MAG: AAA domain-containing protein, partial [Candidatus Kapabacteria bacterium]|nr:AAA domain-containing protein [Candidatus Kapabacteria bacterium]
LEKKLKAIDSNKLNSLDRIIEYYKFVVELEQLKEPSIEDYNYLNYSLNENNEFVIDLESNKLFLDIFNNNKTEKWPKDLNIAVEIEIDTKKYTILNYTYLFDDIQGIDTTSQKVKLQLSSFELNYSTLTSKFEKDEEGIDELENLIKQQNTIEDVINILITRLDQNIKFDNKLSFALSSKNPALSQIYSELRKVNSHSVIDNSLLSNFLFNKPIDNKLNSYSENDLIQISNLDDSQKNAVLTAFNNKVTVITGPPGSGKTQVITNILANAILQNKKVLVASKNNQAVDNVKSRFDKEENLGFFLRFGNKKILGENTLPEINRICALKPALLDNNTNLQNGQEKLNELILIKKENKRKLSKRNELQLKIPEFKINVEKLVKKLSNITLNNPIFEKIRLNHKIGIIETYHSTTKKKRNHFEFKYSGFNKFWIDWFTKQKYAYELITFIDETHIDFKDIFNHIPNQISDFKNGSKILENYNEILKSIELVSVYYNEHSGIKNDLDLKTIELNKAEQYIANVNSQEQEILKIISNCEFEIINQSKVVLKEKIENKLFNSSHTHINNYKDFLPDSIPWMDVDLELFSNATKKFLEIYNIISVTSLSAKTSLPLTNELFDMVVIDEASQCDIASAIPLILRAKQLIVIGDPLQLKHISSLNKFEEEMIKEHLHLSGSIYLKYKEKSLWDYSEAFLTYAKNNNVVVNIDRHYRCHPEIIGYSKEAFYNPKLGVDLKICTKKENFRIEPSGIKWIDVVGKHKADNININEAEVEKSIEIATHFANKYPDISIGIVTPFRHQAEALHNKLPLHLRTRIIANTVNIFQGDEKDVMIYSLVVTYNSPERKIFWIDNMVPESVNVAVTRARNTIYIVGNKDYIKLHSSVSKPLGKLVDYIEKLAK